MRSGTAHTFPPLFCFFSPFFPRASTNPGTFPGLKAWRLPVGAGAARLLSSGYMLAACFPKKPQMLSRQSKLPENQALLKPLRKQEGGWPHCLPCVLFGSPVSGARMPRLAPRAEGAGGDQHKAGAEICTTTWTEQIYWLPACFPCKCGV